MLKQDVRRSLVLDVRPQKFLPPGSDERRVGQDGVYLPQRTVQVQDYAVWALQRGATFQRLMDMVMSGLAFEVCMVCLDDVIVFSNTIDERFCRLSAVLSRLRDAGLKLKPSKCRLLQKHVAFLGHIVSENGISTVPEKVRTVAEWPVPTNLCVHSLDSVATTVVLWRASPESPPLHDMTEKRRTFCWTPESQEAFEQLKSVLTSAPVLAMPDEESVFVLDTDAALTSIGDVLSQRQQGVERVVAYASRKLSKCEINYCVTRKELLSVVYFVKYFKHYFLGRRITVRTDYAALQWLLKVPEPIGQQARWIGFLEEFEYDIVHRPGKQHANADAFSRRPCRSGCCTALSSNKPSVLERRSRMGTSGRLLLTLRHYVRK